jgi:hypothetical protein
MNGRLRFGTRCNLPVQYKLIASRRGLDALHLSAWLIVVSHLEILSAKSTRRALVTRLLLLPAPRHELEALTKVEILKRVDVVASLLSIGLPMIIAFLIWEWYGPHECNRVRNPDP